VFRGNDDNKYRCFCCIVSGYERVWCYVRLQVVIFIRCLNLPKDVQPIGRCSTVVDFVCADYLGVMKLCW